MTNPLQVRMATADDTPAILQLVSLSLGEGSIPRSSDYWRWKHFDNPFGTSPCLVAESDGTLVGLRAFMRWGWHSGRSVVPAVRAVDTATHPDWQGKGIFSKLTLTLVDRMSAEGVGFVFNTPNEKSRPGYLKMGWTSLGKTQLWVRVCRPVRVARALARQSTTPKASAPESAPHDGSSFPSVAALLEQPGLDDLLASLVDDDARLVTRPTREYLSWRYAQVPGFTYHAAWHLEKDAAVAMIFRITRRRSLDELRICELMIGPGSRARAAASRLLRATVRDAKVDYVAAMAAPGTREQAALLGATFLPTPRIGPIFTVRSLASGVSPVDATSAANWRLSIGALELF